jgi:pimeloyl-ACP methyl ester carboxylesterase
MNYHQILYSSKLIIRAFELTLPLTFHFLAMIGISSKLIFSRSAAYFPALQAVDSFNANSLGDLITSEGGAPLILSYRNFFQPLLTGLKPITVLILLGGVAVAKGFTPLRQYFLKLKLATGNIAKLACFASILLFLLQELRLQRDLLYDFSRITRGSLKSVDDVFLHLLSTTPNINTSKSNNKDHDHYNHNQYQHQHQDHTTVVQLFHGFGGNSLSWTPIMREFTGVYSIAHDSPGFGFNARNTTAAKDLAIYRPLWNAFASKQLLISALNSPLSAAAKAEAASKPATSISGVFENKGLDHSTEDQLKASHRIIMGHSMGAVPAMIAAAEALYDASQLPASPLTDNSNSGIDRAHDGGSSSYTSTGTGTGTGTDTGTKQGASRTDGRTTLVFIAPAFTLPKNKSNGKKDVPSMASHSTSTASTSNDHSSKEEEEQLPAVTLIDKAAASQIIKKVALAMQKAQAVKRIDDAESQRSESTTSTSTAVKAPSTSAAAASSSIIGTMWQKVGKVIRGFTRRLLGYLQRAFSTPLKVLSSLVLRRLVHSRWFWSKGLGATWGFGAPQDVARFRGKLDKMVYNTDRENILTESLRAVEEGYQYVDDEVIWRYRLASMARGFEADLVRFSQAQGIDPVLKNVDQVLKQDEPVLTSKLTDPNNNPASNVTVTATAEVDEKEVEKEVEAMEDGKRDESTENDKIKGTDEIKEKVSNGRAVASWGGFPSVNVLPSVNQIELLQSLVLSGCRVIILHGTRDSIVPINLSRNVVTLVNQGLPAPTAANIGSTVNEDDATATTATATATATITAPATATTTTTATAAATGTAVKSVSDNNSSSRGSIELIELPYIGHVPHEENPSLVLSKLKSLGLEF